MKIASARTKSRLTERKKRRKKSKKKPSKEEIEKRKRLDQAKWCNDEGENDKGEKSIAVTDEVSDDAESNCWIVLDGEFASEVDTDDFLQMLKEDGIDVENDSMLHNLLKDNERIHLKRQLGDWIYGTGLRVR